MLVHVGAAVLGVAAQAKLIYVGNSQVLPRRAAMGIVAVRAGDLSFLQRMVIRQAHLRALRLMALQARLVDLPPRREPHRAFRLQSLRERNATGSRGVESQASGSSSLGCLGVNLMTFGASDVFRRVCSSHPVADRCILHMATQANAVGPLGRTRAKADDFGNVSAPFHVQASGTVAILAFDPLQGVKGMPEIAGNVTVTLHTSVRPDPRGPCNLHILRKGANPIR